MKERKVIPLKRKSYDFFLLLPTLLLVFIGVLIVYSSSWPIGMRLVGDGSHFFKKQLISAFFGIGVMIFFMKFDYRFLYKLSIPIYGLSLLLGGAIFTSLGKEVNNARRWLDLKVISFMPSDVIKLASIIMLARVLSKKDSLDSFLKDLLPSLLVPAVSCLLIYLQRDLSTPIVLGATLITMIFIAGMRWLHLLIIGGSGIGLISGIILLSEENRYRLRRVMNFWDPFKTASDGGMQVSQGLLALGSGGIRGAGLGQSKQKFFYLPEAHNDFIFAILGEELGLIGGSIILILLSFIVIRGVRAASLSKTKFGRYLATGITALIAIQSILNIGVVLALVPPTGIALPFISYGGTSLVINMAAMGILLNISKNTN